VFFHTEWILRSESFSSVLPPPYVSELFATVGVPFAEKALGFVLLGTAAIRARVLKPPDERERAVEIAFVGARSPRSSTQSVGMVWG
jgi:hypothetical protein